ncbi:MAG: formate/nitrite transporter family protein [Tissierellia bacterium]|nr:formate/nitrite transporter family protein [Tissierellia bacterium]
MSKVLKPGEILEATSNIGVTKANNRPIKQLLLGVLAGTFIALAAQGSNMAAFNLLANKETFGIGKVVSGLIFTPGLIFVLVAGAELFTGNMLMFVALYDKKISGAKLARTLIIVFIGNLIGSLLITWLMSISGQWANGANELGARTILIANAKVNLSFVNAFVLGLLCNWLVCIGVWMSFGADSQVGKMLSAFFPVVLFVTSGFEHSVANMYYIPAGIMAKANPEFVAATGLGAEALANLTWSGFLVKNILPVTLGNMVGGIVFVVTAYWLAFRNEELF